MAFVACALAVAQLLSALFGFWDDAASKRGLEGLPPYITYEMVEAALECQEEYGTRRAAPSRRSSRSPARATA